MIAERKNEIEEYKSNRSFTETGEPRLRIKKMEVKNR